jgi:Single-strand binding protein family
MLRVTVLGNLGGDAEVRHSANERQVAQFRVAVNQVRTNGAGEREESTEWFRVNVAGRQAEYASRYRLFDVWHDGRHLSAKAFTQHDRPDAAAQEYRSLHIVEPLQIPPNLERVLAEIRESIARPGPTSLQHR